MQALKNMHCKTDNNDEEHIIHKTDNDDAY